MTTTMTAAGANAGSTPDRSSDIRVDLLTIADMIAPGSRVLDVGCGDGALLDYLARFKQVDGRGIEISQAGVNACVAQGLSVVQGDADADLRDYPSGAFDYVVLSQTLQATHRPREVLAQMLRIGRRAVISFPNFGHWRVRLDLLLRGRMPNTGALPYSWHDTPNIHLCTIADFGDLCRELGLLVERRIAIDGQGRIARTPPGLDNLLAEQALFMLRRD